MITVTDSNTHYPLSTMIAINTSRDTFYDLRKQDTKAILIHTNSTTFVNQNIFSIFHIHEKTQCDFIFPPSMHSVNINPLNVHTHSIDTIIKKNDEKKFLHIIIKPADGCDFFSFESNQHFLNALIDKFNENGINYLISINEKIDHTSFKNNIVYVHD